MEPTSQIKDSRGEIRVKSVSCSAIGADDVAPSLIFQPRPNSSCKSEDELDEHRAPVRLEDLAFINASQLLNIAKAIGPLFGDSLVENVLTWQDAANIANAAIRIQEVANGRKPPMQLNGRKRGPESTPPPGSQIDYQGRPILPEVFGLRPVAAARFVASRCVPKAFAPYALVATLPRQAGSRLFPCHD